MKGEHKGNEEKSIGFVLCGHTLTKAEVYFLNGTKENMVNEAEFKMANILTSVESSFPRQENIHKYAVQKV
jgi:hypothetical protein